MRKMLCVMGLAVAGLLLSGCGGDAGSNGVPRASPQEAAQDKADMLAVTWALAKAGTLAYVATCTVNPALSLCSEAVVDGAAKALAVGDVAIAEAKSGILVAGSDSSARAKALSLGLGAIALFQQTMMTYGVESG